MSHRFDKIAGADRSKDALGLTLAQRVVFLALYGHARDNGYQPTIRELAGKWSVSIRCINQKLVALHRHGWIVFPAADHRADQKTHSARNVGSKSRAITFLKRPDGTPFDGFADKP